MLMSFILLILLAYPFIMQIIYFSLNHVHPEVNNQYKDSDCFLKLINETNSEHFSKHPLWPHRGYESKCDAIEYGRIQASQNVLEGLVLKGFVSTEMLVSTGFIIYETLQGRPPSLSLISFGWVAAMNMQYTLHYQHDMHHFVGNLVHHAGPGAIEEKGAGGAVFGYSVPHGLAPNIIVYEFIAPAIMYMAYQFIQPLTIAPFSHYVAIRGVFALMKMRLQTRTAHPYLHKEDQSMFPWPLSVIIDDYNCHITQHHQDGTCLGVVDVLPLNYLYTLLMKGHGILYRDGYVQNGTFLHKMVNIFMDYILFFFTFLSFFIVLKLTSMFSNKNKNKNTNHGSIGQNKKDKKKVF